MRSPSEMVAFAQTRRTSALSLRPAASALGGTADRTQDVNGGLRSAGWRAVIRRRVWHTLIIYKYQLLMMLERMVTAWVCVLKAEGQGVGGEERHQ